MAIAGTRPATRDNGLATDAYFAEERAQVHMTLGGIALNPATGVQFNMFDVKTPIRAWKTFRTTLLNPLQDPAIALRQEDFAQMAGGYSIFMPPGFDVFGSPTTEIPVALFAGPGAELNRHGLRTAFERDGKAVLVTLPGRESAPRFGYGITQAQLVGLFASVGILGVPRVRVLAGFSTGYRGVNGIINNTKSVKVPPAAMATGVNPGTGLDLSGVTKVIYFDAFYAADEPRSGKALGFNTNRALTAIHAETGGTAELIIYDVTGGGTPNPLAATIPKGMPTRHLKVKSSLAHYTALVLSRVVDMAIQDGFTDAAEVTKFGGKPVLDLITAGLPPRGTVGSEVGSGTVNVTNWTTQALANAAAATGQKLVEKLISPQQLMGWPTVDNAGKPSFGEFQHDAHLFEFCWEHLVP
jgi:hypothetical protein